MNSGIWLPIHSLVFYMLSQRMRLRAITRKTKVWGVTLSIAVKVWGISIRFAIDKLLDFKKISAIAVKAPGAVI